MPIITFNVAGSFTIEDDGIPGNDTSIVRRDSDGVILAIIPHTPDPLIFRATVPAVHLTVNITDSLGNTTLTIGSLTNAAETPESIVVRNILSSSTVTLVSNGSITEGGSDLAADVIANAIILSAVSGLGTPGNAIETQTVQIEAETTTGGINIANVGDLHVGGFSGNVDGLDVVTSGDIFLTNLGTITLSDDTAFDSVHGGETSGNVTLIANGYDSDITSNVDQSSIIANRGSIFLTAGRDVSFGLGGVEFGNDVRANNDIVVNAGRDFLLSGFADFFADGVLGTTGGNLIVNAGRDISILDDTGNSGSLAVLGFAGGDIILTTGPGGRLTLEPPSTAAVSSGSGSVTVNADRIIIGATSGITAPGDVTLRPASEGRAILLGSLSDGGPALELSDGELDRVFANTLILGSNSAGAITVGAPIAPGSVTNFTLRSGTDIFADFSLTASNALSLFAGDNIYQRASSTFTSSILNAFVDQVGDDDGAGGTNLFVGTINATSRFVTGDVDNDVLNGTSGNDTINGGGGSDRMSGGPGGDSYFVDNAADIVIEAVGEGSDTIITNASYALGAGQEVEMLRTFGSATTVVVNLTGNGIANTIVGNAAANILDGKGGADVMQGHAGNDTYFVDNGADSVLEAVGGGSDTIIATASHTLGAGQEVELLRTLGSGSAYAVNLTGNALANTIQGNAAVNTLDGKGGIDTMQGFAGNDTYVVDNGADSVIEAAGGGSDTVISNASYALGAGQEIEVLRTFGSATTEAVNFTGNTFANTLIGNAAANVLDGKSGSDTLHGFAGADTFRFSSTLGAGNVDTIADFNAAADTIALHNSVFTGLPLGALNANAFVVGAAAADASDRIIYNNATGQLFFDPDGTGAAAAVQFATLTGAPAITASDFTVI